jgi:hypothetical protein
MLFKVWQSHKSLQRRRPHFLHVFKPHVVFHQRQNLFGMVIREA